MRFIVERKIRGFGSGKDQYGVLVVTSKNLQPYIGKMIRINIEIIDIIEAN